MLKPISSARECSSKSAKVTAVWKLPRLQLFGSLGLGLRVRRKNQLCAYFLHFGERLASSQFVVFEVYKLADPLPELCMFCWCV